MRDGVYEGRRTRVEKLIEKSCTLRTICRKYKDAAGGRHLSEGRTYVDAFKEGRGGNALAECQMTAIKAIGAVSSVSSLHARLHFVA